MSTSVLECLENSKINLETLGRLTGLNRNPVFVMAMEQLSNGIAALENGKTADDVIQDNMFDEVRT